MQLAEGLASITDMSILALAVGLALTFEGPDQADIVGVNNTAYGRTLTSLYRPYPYPVPVSLPCTGTGISP